jgi:hypothetical protein
MPESTVADAEKWFVDHGLPYFVDSVRDEVRSDTRPSRRIAVLLVALVIGVAITVIELVVLDFGGGNAAIVGFQASLVVIGVYVFVKLRVGGITVWAGRRTFGSLGLLFPLVTRALPLLLLFITFLFINTEVWQVASRLDGRVMWLTVLLFIAVAVGFLLARLPEELDVFDEQLDAEQIRAGCKGTPFEPMAQACSAEELDAATDHIEGLQKVNLVLVLLIAQLIQVLLLSLSVFAFFLVFGSVAIHPDVIKAWLGDVDTLHPLLGREWLSHQLLQVSVFLAAFSGLYFTVYAVSDGNYRKQFFSAILDELQQAISARAAYRVMRRRTQETT